MRDVPNIPRGSQLNEIRLYTDGKGNLTRASSERLLNRVIEETIAYHAEQENNSSKDRTGQTQTDSN